MRFKLIHFCAFLALAVVMTGGCQNNPTPPPVPPPVVTDTTKLYLTTTTPDTVLTADGESFLISFIIMKGGKLVDSAFVDFYDSILHQQRHLGPSGASGEIDFNDPLPQQGITLRVYRYNIIASKAGQSDTIVRYVKVGVDPVPLVLAVTAPLADTSYVKHGASIRFDFLIKHRTVAEDTAFVNFFDPLLSSQLTPENVGPTTGGTGMLTHSDIIGSDVPSGPYTITFIATRRDRLQSNAVSKVVWVIGSDSEQMSVRAHSINATSIGVSWKPLATDKGADTVVAMSGSTLAAKATAPHGQSTAVLSGLTAGTTYSISVRSATAFSETILWATAIRFGPIRLYENSDPDATHPCGLVLASQATEHITATGPAPLSDIMLATDTSGDSVISLISPSASPQSHRLDGKLTKLSDFFIYGGSLDDISFASDLSGKFTSGVNAYRMPPGQTSNMIFQALTVDNHYAQVEVVTQSDGTLYGTTVQGYHYVDVNISYQPTAGLPYAGRGHRTHGSEAERVGRLK
jgi:hypothetical protein